MTNKRRMDIGQPAISATALYGYNILLCNLLSFTIIPIAMVSIFTQTSLYISYYFLMINSQVELINQIKGWKIAFQKGSTNLHSHQQHIKPLGSHSENHSLNTCFLSNSRWSLVILFWILISLTNVRKCNQSLNRICQSGNCWAVGLLLDWMYTRRKCPWRMNLQGDRHILDLYVLIFWFLKKSLKWFWHQ